MTDWDESEHPRVPGGNVNGGQFTDKGLSAAEGAAREAAMVGETLSEAEKRVILRGLQRNDFYDRVPLDQTKSPADDYEYKYWSYARPFEHTWGKLGTDYQLSEDGSVIFTKKPLSLKDQAKFELAPQSIAARTDTIIEFYRGAYGLEGGLAFRDFNTENIRGAVITPSTRTDNNWQLTWYDERGFSGDSTHKTLKDAVVYLEQGGRFEPTSPTWIDKISKYWR